MTKADKILVLDGARTPVGSFGDALKAVPGFELGATAAIEALSRSGVEAEAVDEVVMGCIDQVGTDAYNARRVALAAGLPKSVPAYTVNRLCGSGLQAIWSAAMQLRWGGISLALAGGDESMSRMPLGHPVGATGAILALRVAKHLRRIDGELGIVTMCIGSGQALAALFPPVPSTGSVVSPGRRVSEQYALYDSYRCSQKARRGNRELAARQCK